MITEEQRAEINMVMRAFLNHQNHPEAAARALVGQYQVLGLAREEASIALKELFYNPETAYELRLKIRKVHKKAGARIPDNNDLSVAFGALVDMVRGNIDETPLL